MEKKTLVKIVSVLVVLVLFLPIFINILLRVDWFSSIVMGGESGWLSFYGSYLGGILGGVLTLVGVILTIKYQEKLREDEKSERNDRGIKNLNRLLDKAYYSLYQILELAKMESVSQDTLKDLATSRRNDYNLFFLQIEEIGLENIPHEFTDEFLSMKDDLLRIDNHFSSEAIEQYSKAGILKDYLSSSVLTISIFMVIKNHEKMAEESFMRKLLFEEVELNKNEA
ncbi:hypothetical protein [Planococcus sp. S3-L1]|uniref:hypothetical protein n=1 Tax=Planococcus sp. S3-L1 TaxID=3046200 RepID=UPI0024BA98C8|nr:hypothetical protein [Planococcus sp. S3-L1]MDJ0333295.1 hypothetical protein [Planococcus sp. S3-L1]